MNDESNAWVDDALDALASADAGLSPPARVEAAVLREWDAHQVRQARPRPAKGSPSAFDFAQATPSASRGVITRWLHRRRPWLAGSIYLARSARTGPLLRPQRQDDSRSGPHSGPIYRWFVWALVPAAAGVLVAVTLLQRGPVTSSEPGAPPAERAAPAAAAAVVSPPVTPPVEAAVVTPSTHPVPVPPRPRPIADAGYVIVPDPLVDPTTLRVVRVRMSRTALATLGMPLVNPDADSLVEVEMLVGDEGVAQSIRRAALVSEPAKD